MQTSNYLYGNNLHELSGLLYPEALVIKIVYANKLLHELVHTDQMADSQRINAVSKAKIFNRNLLLELGFEDTDISKLVKEKTWK